MGITFNHSNRIHDLENQLVRVTTLNERLQEKLAEEDSRSHMQCSMIENLRDALKRANQARHEAEKEVERLKNEQLPHIVINSPGVTREHHREVVNKLNEEIRRIGRDYVEQQNALRMADRFKSELKAFLGEEKIGGGPF